MKHQPQGRPNGSCRDPCTTQRRGLGNGITRFWMKNVPNEILELPVGAETCNLEYENSVVVQQVINLAQESRVATNTDMLSEKSRV